MTYQRKDSRATMTEAIQQGMNFTSHNTSIVFNGDSLSVCLHNSCIAVRDVIGRWSFTLAGWPTPLTRSRLNELSEITRVTFHQRKGKQYMRNKDTGKSIEIDDTDWYHQSDVD